MTSSLTRDPVALRGYSVLLACYPRSFRARFEPGMRDAFEQDHEAARRRGHGALAWFWCVTIWQAVVFGLAARRPARGAPMGLRFVDWRDAWRSLRATPVVSAVAVLSLALGTGANTALFSILNSLLYKPLPVQEPERLVLMDGIWTNPIWEQVRDRQDRFSSGAFAWCTSRLDLSESGETDYVYGAYASGRMFDVLGVPAAAGRMLGEADDVRGGGPGGHVAVIGYDFWQGRFGGAPNVVGRTMTVQRAKFTIVGVMPKGFFGPDVGTRFSVVIPIADTEYIRGNRANLDGRSTWWLQIMARLKPGQMPEDAAKALNAERAAIREVTIPTNWRPQDLESYLKDPWKLEPAVTGTSDLRGSYRSPLVVVLVIVGVVLVIACANLANLLIARSTSRRHELSVRLALGATRWRLARQLLIESLILALTGAALGLVFAQWGSALLVRQISDTTFLDLTPDIRVLAFTAGVAVLTAVLFGVAPALGVVAVRPTEALRERSRAGGDSRFGIRHVLVVAQVALSVGLVAGAGLFLRTFVAMSTRPIGFEPDRLLDVSVNLTRSRLPKAAWDDLWDRLQHATEAVPGVESASLSYMTPMGNRMWNTLIIVPNRPNLPERERAPMVNLVTPGWFRTMGMRLVAGRDFDARDRAGAPPGVVVTRTFVQKYLDAGDPVGQQVIEEESAQRRTYDVIGVVEDSAYNSMREELPAIMYLAAAQTPDPGPQGSMELSVRARSGDPGELTRPVTAALMAVDPKLSLTTRPLARNVQGALRRERLVAMLSGFFGALALLLAGLGLYGVTSYAVSRRRSEIGIRMALGARPEGIVRMILARTAWLVAIGAAGGMVISVWVTRYVATLLYDVPPRDPMTLAGAAIVLAAVGLVAAWLPARRAARIDPTIALRTE